MAKTRDYMVNISRENDDGHVTYEGEFRAEMARTSKGYPATRDEPAASPEFEVRSITETWNNQALSLSHQLWDEISEDALEQAYEDDWSDADGPDPDEAYDRRRDARLDDLP